MSDSIGPLVEPAPEVRPVSLRAALVRGAAWATAANTLASALSSIVGLLLARILVPSDFGIQTAVFTVTAFFSTIADTSLGAAIVQRDDLDHRELSTIFWAGLGASALIFLGLLAATPLIALLFSSAALNAAMPVASSTVLIVACSVVPAALLRRRLAFASLARAQAAGAAFGASASVVLAFVGAGYWSLIFYSLTAAAVSTALICRSAGWSPAATFQWIHLEKIRGYAGSMMGFLTVNYWARNLDDLLIGRFLGINALGVFGLAQRMVGAPVQLLTGGIVPLLHPTFAAMGDDTARQQKAYLDLVRVTALVTFSAAAMLWVLSDLLVLVVAGPPWAEAGGVVRALAVLAAIQPVNMLCGPVFMARNAAHLMLRVAIIGSAAVVAGMLLGLSRGVEGVAWGYSVAYLLVSAPVASITAFKLLDGRAADLARAFGKSIGVATLVLLVEQSFVVLMRDSVSPPALLVVMSLVSMAAFAVIIGPTVRRLRQAR